MKRYGEKSLGCCNLASRNKIYGIMAKIGDTVRFLNSIGGGKITRIKENIAYVEDEIGFETPILLKECVVVDSPKAPTSAYDRPIQPSPSKYVEPEKPKVEEFRIEETETGDKLNVVLAFEPVNIKNLSSSTFDTYLVNDSNYYLYFSYMSKGDDGWISRYNGIVEPNIQVRLENFEYTALPQMSRVAVQFIAFKKDKPFAIKNPVSVEHKLDTTRFYKLHSFRENEYFDSPVIALEIIKNDIPYRGFEIDPEQLQNALREQKRIDSPARKPVHKAEKAEKNLIECDLHIDSLLDNKSGMNNSDLLNVQLDKFREVMDKNIRFKGSKIVFIHGKGEGVLRKALLDELKKKYPKCTSQDASFREYGFGATLITIH